MCWKLYLEEIDSISQAMRSNLVKIDFIIRSCLCFQSEPKDTVDNDKETRGHSRGPSIPGAGDMMSEMARLLAQRRRKTEGEVVSISRFSEKDHGIHEISLFWIS
jgi:hypothetical protein